MECIDESRNQKIILKSAFTKFKLIPTLETSSFSNIYDYITLELMSKSHTCYNELPSIVTAQLQTKNEVGVTT